MAVVFQPTGELVCEFVFFTFSLDLRGFPPTDQSHAGQVNWRLEIPQR